MNDANHSGKSEIATFGAGCFWGVEARFRAVDGVLDATSGYMGGDVDDPGYEAVCTGTTGHAEVVQVRFDPRVVSFEALATLFFEMHDPTTLNRQGPDIGHQYRSVIFYHSDAQHAAAHAAIRETNESGRWRNPVVTTLEPAKPFWRAEEYHQRYLEKHGLGACSI